MRLDFFWSDTNLSWLRYMCFATFRHHNPEWEMVLHTASCDVTEPMWSGGERCESFGFDGDDHRHLLEGLGVKVVQFDAPEGVTANHAAELCRWDCLADGLMFADTDIVWVAPITDAHMEVLSKPSISYEGCYRMGLMGGGAPFIPMRDLAYERIGQRGYQALGPDIVYSFSEEIGGLSEAGGGVTNIPMHWVHPFASTDTALREIFHTDYDLPEGCIGIHWYAGGIYGQQETRTATPESTGGLYEHIRGIR